MQVLWQYAEKNIDHIVKEAYSRLLNGDDSSLSLCRSVLTGLTGHEQKAFLYAFIRVLSRHQLQDEKTLVRGAGRLISSLVLVTPSLQDQLGSWLVEVNAESIGQSHLTHRAVVLAISINIGTSVLVPVLQRLMKVSDRLKSTAWKALELFSDKLFIKHSPILHQEGKTICSPSAYTWLMVSVNTQILLLLAGHIYREDRDFLSTVSKSGVYLSGISNHLASSSPQARFLGMAVGSAVSELLDEPTKQLKFKAEDSESVEWRWYRSLICLDDHFGNIADLKPKANPTEKTIMEIGRKSAGPKATSKLASGSASKIVRIEEIEDDSESEEDDLPTYEKPDSDPSDDDEDPELVQRNKPSAPV